MKEQKKPRLSELAGKLFTIIWVNALGMTCTLRGHCFTIVLPHRGDLQLIFRKGRERRLRTVAIQPDMLIFAGGAALPVKSDLEADIGTWHRNECLNICAPSPAMAREYIETHNLNPLFGEEARAKVIHHARGMFDSSQTLVYPEIASDHAAVVALKDEACVPA